MSNADDRCSYVDSDGQCRYLRGNHWYVDGWHALVEPAPQPTRCPVHSQCADDAYSQCRLAAEHEPKGHNFEPQPAPSGDYAFCKFVDGKMIECDGCGNEPGWRERNHPAPSGDEAKVREIALRWFPGLMDAGMPAVLGAVREVYADGKADGAREEREACEKAARDEADQSVTAEEIADAIARRGSEGT